LTQPEALGISIQSRFAEVEKTFAAKPTVPVYLSILTGTRQRRAALP